MAPSDVVRTWSRWGAELHALRFAYEHLPWRTIARGVGAAAGR